MTSPAAPAGSMVDPPSANSIPSREQGWEAWRLVVGLSVVSLLLIGGMMTSLSIYLPVLQRELGWTESQLAVGPAALLFSMSASNLLAGPALRRIGLRRLLGGGLLAAVCGWCLAGFATSAAAFGIAMAITGLGVGAATIVPSISAITDRFVHRRGFAIAWYIGACAISSAFAPALSALLIDILDWRSAFLASGVTILLVGALVYPAISASLTPAPAPVKARDKREKGALRSMPFWMLALALTLSQSTMNAILFGVVLLFETSGFSRAAAVSLYSAANLMAVPGLFIGGWLADRFGARLILPAALLLQAVGTLFLLSMSGPPAGGHWFSATAFVIIWGMSGGLPAQIGPMRLAEITSQTNFPTLLGITFTLQGMVSSTAPLLFGSLYGATQSYALPVAVTATLAALAATLCMFARPRDKGNRRAPRPI